MEYVVSSTKKGAHVDSAQAGVVRRGFLLIEFIIYFAVATTLFTVSFQAVSSLYLRMLGQSTFVNRLTEWHCAQDVFARDVQRAPCQRWLFKKVTEQSLIWAQGNEDIGWILEDGTLMRYAGTYDVVKQEWKKKVKSLVVQDVQRCVFAVVMQQGKQLVAAVPLVAGIGFELGGTTKGKMQGIKRFVAIRAKVV